MTLQRSRSAGYMTNWAARLFARAIDRRLKPLGISSGQLPVFFALGEGAALSQKRLTELAAIEQPTMAATLSRMERDGLVEKRPDPDDRRSSLVALTPVAMEKARGVREAIAGVNAVALAAFSSGEQQAYLEMLAKITSALDGLED
jgi:MarR family transcriptional regulator for hemolysin